ncbi:uncharacterized protein VTP21DRAFT_4623 [Calcarisporiella thermophila]|uniref:uncharacterized protein n=1 Tax=Calcarisporiella thermophila TaxID=911321 RepID=UPI003743ECA6
MHIADPTQAMTVENKFIVEHAKTSKQIEQCRFVRIEVFVHEQKFPLESEIDEHEEESLHLLGLEYNSQTETYEPVGNVRIYRTDPSTGKIGRLAVLNKCRGRGYGSILMREAERIARQEWGVSRLAIHSQYDKVTFYAQLGYVAEGEMFDEEGMDHMLMVKT